MIMFGEKFKLYPQSIQIAFYFQSKWRQTTFNVPTKRTTKLKKIYETIAFR